MQKPWRLLWRQRRQGGGIRRGGEVVAGAVAGVAAGQRHPRERQAVEEEAEEEAVAWTQRM